MINKLYYNYFTTIIWNKNQVKPRTSWGSFNSPSHPSFPTPFEYILVFSKNKGKLTHKGINDLTKEEFIKFSLSLWNIAPSHKMKKYKHPAIFPEEIPYRLIKMFTYQNDIILDPFAGSGTTGIVAKQLNRQFILIEKKKEYFDICISRIKKLGDN